MPIGPGKYNAIGELVLHATQAQAVAVIVFNGKLGSGFEVQSMVDFDQNRMADVLQLMVDQIREDQKDVAAYVAEMKQQSKDEGI